MHFILVIGIKHPGYILLFSDMNTCCKGVGDAILSQGIYLEKEHTGIRHGKPHQLFSLVTTHGQSLAARSTYRSSTQAPGK